MFVCFLNCSDYNSMFHADAQAASEDWYPFYFVKGLRKGGKNNLLKHSLLLFWDIFFCLSYFIIDHKHCSVFFSCLEMLHYRRAWRTLSQNWGNRNIVNSFVYVTEKDASIYFLCTTWIIPWTLLGNCLQANFIGLEMCLYFKSQIRYDRKCWRNCICCHTWKNIQQFNPRRCWNPNTMEYAWSWWDMFLLDFGVKFTHSLSDKFINSL